MHYCVDLPDYIGPFENLYQELATKRQSLQTLSLAWLVDGFLAYARDWCEYDLDEASNFLVMTSSLLQWKVLLLFPKLPLDDKDEQNVEEAEEQQQHLDEYRQFQSLALLLAGYESERQQSISREPMDPSTLGLPAPDPLARVSIRDLVRAFDRVFILADELDEPTPIARDQLTVEERMEWLQKELMEQGTWVPFGRVFSGRLTRLGLIVTFLALLELVRLGKITAVQEGPQDEIMLAWAD